MSTSNDFTLPDSEPIERIVLHKVAMPLVEMLATSFGGNVLRSPILVELHMGGAVGWGESVASWTPDYSYETVGTVMHTLTDFFIPAVIGKRNLNDLHQYCGHSVGGHALESAYLS